MKITAILSIVILMSFSALAQQQPSFLQYTYNTISINPAYAGYHNNLAFNFSGAGQHLDMEGGQRTTSFSVHGPIPDKKIAVGGVFINDKIGVTSTNSVFGTYAYNFISRQRNSYTSWKDNPHVLSVGLQAGATFYNEDLTSLRAPNDPKFDQNVNEVVPTFGAGIYYSRNTVYIGFSVPRLLGNSFGDNITTKRHYYLNAGKQFKVGENSRLNLSSLAKFVNGSPIQYDVHGAYNWYGKFSLGAGYSSLSTLNFSTGIRVGGAFTMTYFFGLPIHDNSDISSGKHEFMLSYVLKKNKS
ncbi:PorP/SprF family type IX secretion system membrane protein [Fulvivirga sp. 29W222]|uniref:PorP/SprF family type IX secretion system membrane protein n=1 Tax=Fulvivirga marina TaxID=2494733 RepID=A0A937G060_9BACT|nr:PorP/SprF family type IX secretion system membrane protein [Fulvivirga marina]MBL6449380.1 PorP/SprF family type IX secretion system membrane protein [Fulvivirga marina]